MTDEIALTRDTAADSIAIVRLLRQNQPDMAMFILSTYENDNDGLQALVGSMAAFCAAVLGRVDDGDAVLASATAAVVSYDPSQDGKASGS